MTYEYLKIHFKQQFRFASPTKKGKKLFYQTHTYCERLYSLTTIEK